MNTKQKKKEHWIAYNKRKPGYVIAEEKIRERAGVSMLEWIILVLQKAKNNV